MPLTNQGFEARKFSDILPEINQSLATSLGIDVNTAPETILGILTTLFTSAIAKQEALALQVADSSDIDKAEGVFLDRLVALNSIKRLGEASTVGSVFITAAIDGLTVPTGTLFQDNQSNTYTLPAAKIINSSACTKLTFVPDASLGTFTVNINNTEFTETYVEVTDATTIAADLEFAINNSLPEGYTVSRDNEKVTITIENVFSTLNITRNENISFTEVEGRAEVIAEEVGPINPPINTVNTILSNSTNVVNVTNYDTFTIGRLKESDEGLRARQATATQTTRGSVLGAIFSRLSNLDGVSLVRIFENRTALTDPDGRPSHSYECVVEGGDPVDIAQSIWDSKPAGVETYGTLQSAVLDYANQPEIVNWSRPVLKYINVRVTYSVYSEETLPDDVEQAIKDALTLYGDALGLDTDIIPQRMYGTVYGAVEGVGAMTIEVGTSLNPSSTTPDENSLHN